MRARDIKKKLKERISQLTDEIDILIEKRNELEEMLQEILEEEFNSAKGKKREE